MTLSDFLNVFDFGYEIIDNDFEDTDNKTNGKVIRLIDWQGVDLGGIEEERYNLDCIDGIVDRLNIYYTNYILEDLYEEFNIDTNGTYEEIYNRIKDNKNVQYHANILYYILNPNEIVLDKAIER